MNDIDKWVYYKWRSEEIDMLEVELTTKCTSVDSDIKKVKQRKWRERKHSNAYY